MFLAEPSMSLPSRWRLDVAEACFALVRQWVAPGLDGHLAVVLRDDEAFRKGGQCGKTIDGLYLGGVRACTGQQRQRLVGYGAVDRLAAHIGTRGQHLA